ncbi:helix-turn-helix domain-containing protein [Streptomyces sp. CB03911]|uniref:helix-turn-helix domain-containing protein n=1 Tax=Streptomyces sp. CB03911 TaxID=1804758 RepID=UPI00093A5A2A|nr:helix-turn-helix domain-containing protein [Streptomyces sp. CB03911]OKI19258.1 hypothetical protein A6A07_07090 [Streptomyces sp. CB03911]
MRIHRIKHKGNFTVLGNVILRRHSLSFCARGLLAYLLSLPDASREDVRTLAAKSVEGRVTIAKALNELVDAGLYVRTTHRDPVTGQVRTTVDVYDVPPTEKKCTSRPLPASLAAGRPGPGKPAVGKAGMPPLEVKTISKEEVKLPSVPPAEEAYWEEPGDIDPDELREAYAAFSGLLGGLDGESPATTPEKPSEPRQSTPTAAPRAKRPEQTTEGMALLVALGLQQPEMRLAGKPLTDQAAMVEGLLAAGWTWDELTKIIGAPLPVKITTSVAAVLAQRIRLIPVNPPKRPTDEQHAPAVRKPAPPRFDCRNCRAPGLPAPGLCRKCRGDGPASPPAPLTEPSPAARAAALELARAGRERVGWKK